MISNTDSATRAPADALKPDKVVTVLAISPYLSDHLVLGDILAHSSWRIRFARCWRDARGMLAEAPAPVIICESQLPDASWKLVQAELACQRHAPALIVTSRIADDLLWAEVLNLGGYDVLMKPFEQSEVFRVVGLAWLNWKENRERRRRLQATAPHLALAAGM